MIDAQEWDTITARCSRGRRHDLRADSGRFRAKFGRCRDRTVGFRTNLGRFRGQRLRAPTLGDIRPSLVEIDRCRAPVSQVRTHKRLAREPPKCYRSRPHLGQARLGFGQIWASSPDFDPTRENNHLPSETSRSLRCRALLEPCGAFVRYLYCPPLGGNFRPHHGLGPLLGRVIGRANLRRFRSTDSAFVGALTPPGGNAHLGPICRWRGRPGEDRRCTWRSRAKPGEAGRTSKQQEKPAPRWLGATRRARTSSLVISGVAGGKCKAPAVSRSGPRGGVKM